MNEKQPAQADPEKVPHVLTAMVAVSAGLAKMGIAKASKNKDQNFMYRGVDDVMNAIAPLLVANKLLIIPRYYDRACEARRTKSGGNIYNVTLRCELNFTSAVDGSVVTSQMWGEGMDSADKATNKAMAIAYKYGVMQGFCIPLEPTADPDSESHEETAAEGQVTKADVEAVVDDIELRFVEADELPELATLFTQAQADLKRYAVNQKWERDWLADSLGAIAKAKDKRKKKLQEQAKGQPAGPRGDEPAPPAHNEGGDA
jgi:hypothetical protein